MSLQDSTADFSGSLRSSQSNLTSSIPHYDSDEDSLEFDALGPSLPPTVEVHFEEQTGEGLRTSCDRASHEAPAGGILNKMGNFLSKQVFGVSSKDLKGQFEAAWQKDAGSASNKAMWAKRIGRIAGLTLGGVVNAASRVLAVALAVTAGVTTGVLIGIFKPKWLWKHPEEGMQAILAAGTVVGAGVGGLAGTIGTLLVSKSLDQKMTSTDDSGKRTGVVGTAIERSVQQNAKAAILGAKIAVGVSLLNPLVWPSAAKGGAREAIELIKDSTVPEDPLTAT